MANRKNKKQNTHTTLKELVTVAFAEDMDLAKQYKKLLAENDITAVINTKPDISPAVNGIAVMVQEEDLDEAHMVVQSHGSFNDFYETAFEDYDYERFEEDLEEDDEF